MTVIVNIVDVESEAETPITVCLDATKREVEIAIDKYNEEHPGYFFPKKPLGKYLKTMFGDAKIPVMNIVCGPDGACRND